MFWRLFFTYLLLVVAAVALVGAIIYQRAEELFYDLARDVAFAVFLVLLAAVGAAYLLARWFTRPLDQLTESAQRIADGGSATRFATPGAAIRPRSPRPSAPCGRISARPATWSNTTANSFAPFSPAWSKE